MHRIVDVLDARPLGPVPQQDDLVSGKVPPPQVLGEDLTRFVGRGVVDDDDSEVGVVLLHDGFDVPRVSIVGHVSVARTDDAGAQFVRVVLYLIL